MHRLKPFLNVGLNNFLILGLKRYKKVNQRKKTDCTKLAIRKSMNIIEIKYAVLHV